MARCIVKVVGMAKRATGTTKKTGKPFDIVKCAFAFQNAWGDADVACGVIDGSVVDKLHVAPGKNFDAVVQQYDNRYFFELINEVR